MKRLDKIKRQKQTNLVKLDPSYPFSLSTALKVVSIGTVSASLCAQNSFFQNFDSQTPGSTATGFTTVAPANATDRPTGRGTVVVNQSTGDNALNFYDYSNSSSSRISQDFTPAALGQVSFEFQRNASIARVGDTAALAFGLASTDGFLFEVRLFNDGTILLNRGLQDSGGQYVGEDLFTPSAFEPSGTTFGAHTLNIYAYSAAPGSATVPYLGPDSILRFLDANSFVVFVDGNLITPTTGATANGNFGMLGSASYDTTENISRFGMRTGATLDVTGVDFVVDNIALYNQVPEASTGWAVLPTGLAFLAWRRLRRR
jgi:hypothetical protein